VKEEGREAVVVCLMVTLLGSAVEDVFRIVKLDESVCDALCLTMKLDERPPKLGV
jgi:hypothetical protein